LDVTGLDSLGVSKLLGYYASLDFLPKRCFSTGANGFSSNLQNSETMSFFSGRLYKIKADCGHMTWRKAKVHAFGTSCATELPIEAGHTPYCHACIEKMAIRCAWCGKPIFIGDPVTLYTPAKPDFKIPEHAVRYSADPIRLVGCLRMDCAESGADRTGFWMPPGKVMRVMSPIEQMLATGNPVIVNDLGDFREAVETTGKHASPNGTPETPG